MNFPVYSQTPVWENAMRLRNCNCREFKRLDVQSVLVQPFSEEYSFSHHAAITVFNNRTYILWSSGKVNEDDCGQRVMWAYCENFNSWCEPKILSDTEMGEKSQYVKFAQGFCNTGRELYVYYSVCEIDSRFLAGENLRPKILWENPEIWAVSKRYARKLNKDGISWGDPIEVESGGGNHSAEMGLNGRMIIPLSTGICYCDNTLSDNIPLWKYSSIQKGTMEKVRQMGAKDLCEASQYYTDDGIMHLVMRSGENRLWYAESLDNGETFSQAYPTCFTDDLAKFQFGRLPDGRYYYVGNPIVGRQRCALILYVSDDGFNFDKGYIIHDEPAKICKHGMAKGGHYGYPECFIHDGYMIVCYSKQKEKIEVTRFNLSQIGKE